LSDKDLWRKNNLEYTNKEFCIEVQSPYACFTRPEMKVERVSYDVITPSAARAVFEAIFWKPAIRWRVQKIEVLKPILWTSVRRNEVGAIANDRSGGVFIEDARQQRAGLFLRDVAYRLHAQLEFVPPQKRVSVRNPVPEYLVDASEQDLVRQCEKTVRIGRDENPGKYNAMFERRARKGQCFNQPYLGCREFSCAFRFVDLLEGKVGSDEPAPIDETRDLGFMLYDLDFTDIHDPKPAFFRPTMEQGVIVLPRWEADEVRK
jgi:CRISPR-associated protein Cas5d